MPKFAAVSLAVERCGCIFKKKKDCLFSSVGQST